MPLIEYPASLPGPRAFAFGPPERRAISELDGNTGARGRRRARLVRVPGIEEYVDLTSGHGTENADNEQLLVFSARNAETLHATLQAYPEFLARTDRSADTLRRIAHTLQTGRTDMQERVAFVARSIDEFDELLKGFLEEKDDFYHRKVYRGSSKAGTGDKLDIGDTQAGQEFMRRLVETGEIGKIAELWVRGAKLDWRILRP